MKFRICVIGCGAMSTSVHGPSFKKYASTYPDTELSACCDLVREKAEVYKEKFGFKKAYTSYDEMLEKEKPHAVCLITNVIHTKDLAVDIMRKGFPVLMEKPPGINPSECEEIICVSEETGVPARAAFNRRYQPLVKELKSLLKEEKQPVYNVYYNMLRSGRYDEDFSTTAIHAIDTVRFLLDSDYESVSIRYQHLPQHGETVANIYLDGKMKSGTLVRLEFVVDGGALIERSIINCSNSTFLLNTPVGTDAPGRLTHMRKGRVLLDKEGDINEEFYITGGFYNENAEFFDLVKRNSPEIGDVKTGLQSVIIADCIRNRIEKYVF
ncbi:MAG: Gfo/Idh/MocA family protein [Caldicoprobacterales bacterium]|jgi:myo-inositol 2-dehydrogenase/D-chiro-inositol 1-dehydrogenase|nr:Gfo/Idh/MocA family oxidoreductase [Clostridiales bacterium]